jgi:hypothetical protein
MVLKRILGPKRDDVMVGWRVLHKEGLYDLYSSRSIIKSRRMRWAAHVARMWEKRKMYRLLVRKPEGKRPLEDQDVGGWKTFKMDLVELRWSGVNWIGLAQGKEKWRAIVNAVMNFRFPLNAGKLSSGYTPFQSKRLNANIKLTLRKALIRSVITYACPA